MWNKSFQTKSWLTYWMFLLNRNFLLWPHSRSHVAEVYWCSIGELFNIITSLSQPTKFWYKFSDSEHLIWMANTFTRVSIKLRMMYFYYFQKLYCCLLISLKSVSDTYNDWWLSYYLLKENISCLYDFVQRLISTMCLKIMFLAGMKQI
jgi:hypothetical protein